MAHGMTRRLKKMINNEAAMLDKLAQRAKRVADDETDPDELREVLEVLFDDLEGIRDSLRGITGGAFDSR